MPPRNATAEIGQRRKYTFQGVDYPSVTTILKLGRPKEWLGAWAAKMVAEAAVDGTDDWQAWDREVAIKHLKGSPWRKRDTAAALGTSIHDVLEALAYGREIPADAPSRDRLEEWREVYRPAIYASEAQVVNPTDGYAGSLDLIADIYGRRLLIDLKTGKRLDGQGRVRNIDRDWCLQLAAYRYATYTFEDERSWSMPEVDGCAVLWVPSDVPDFWALIELPAAGAEYAAFLAAKATHDDYRRYERQALGEIILPQALEVA